MRLIVLSDTHIHLFQELSPVVKNTLNSADLIIHTGDFTGMDVLSGLRNIAEVKAVQGNMDNFDIRRELPVEDTFNILGKTIGIIHGWGSPQGMEDKIIQRFDKVDMIIFGHTHRAYDKTINGIRLFNAGPAHESFGIIEIDTAIQSRIITI